MSRDSQRQRVYNAENRARSTLEANGHIFRDVKSERRYRERLDAIMGSKWMQEHYPEATKRVVDLGWGACRRGANAGWHGINTSITDFALHEMVLIHELSHVIEKRTRGIVDPGHGREFCIIYLALVKRFISADAERVLKQWFRDCKVRYVRKRKTTGTARPLPAALAAANERRKAEAATRWYEELRARGHQKVDRRGWVRAEANIWTTYDKQRVIRLRNDYGTKRDIDYPADPRVAYAAWQQFLSDTSR